MIKKIIRLINTLRYLKLNQLYFFILRRKFASSNIYYTATPALHGGFILAEPIKVNKIWQGDNNYHFLNITQSLFLDEFNWQPKDVPRLWRYNLHYFDYLRQADFCDEKKNELIESWIENNPQGSQPGWEPFTASLRIVNWIFYFQSCEKEGVIIPALWLTSLYEQVLWLEKNDERHILANHYFENLKALTFAGSYFIGDDARRWLNKGTKELKKQLIEQTLSDGGHYERTPQYHALMLENYLDLFNLTVNNKTLFDDEGESLLEETSRLGLQFLVDIIFPDKKFPLFNDSDFGIAPNIDSLSVYAELLGKPLLEQGSSKGLIDKGDSGLYGYRSEKDMLIIDCGDIGPSYQPGHTHCDFLSYELMLDGHRLVVDTGVCEYEPGEMRQYVRSTQAHNTVSVDGDEQSEIWGEFRVARRAKKLSASIKRGLDNKIVFNGAYKGFYGIAGGIEHQRQLQMALDDGAELEEIVVRDQIIGGGEHTVESFIHLHPSVELIDLGKGQIKLSHGNNYHAMLTFSAMLNYRIDDAIYCPEFGKQLKNKRVVFTQTCPLPCEMTYSIKKIQL
jgi:uncharacterized heparinase superfamily protein